MHFSEKQLAPESYPNRRITSQLIDSVPVVMAIGGEIGAYFISDCKWGHARNVHVDRFVSFEFDPIHS